MSMSMMQGVLCFDYKDSLFLASLFDKSHVTYWVLEVL